MSYVVLIARHFACDPATLDEARLRDYFLFLRTERHYAPRSMSLALAALKAFFVDYLGCGKGWKLWRDLRVRRVEALPTVLSRAEVARLLAAVQADRFRTVLRLIYHCGLRIREACRVEVTDMKATEGRLLLRDGKGGKSRYVPIGPEMIADLRRFWRRHRHPRFLFPGLRCNWKSQKEPLSRKASQSQTPMCEGTVQNAFRLALAVSGIKTKATPHTLRHSYATHLLEEGVSIRLISQYLGHASLDTTLVYTHLTAVSEEKAVHALQRLFAQTREDQQHS